MKQSSMFIVLTLLVTAVLACALPGGAEQPTAPALDVVQTSVAATLTAAAPTSEPGVTLVAPTDTPSAVDETPVPTELPAPSVVCPVAVGFTATVMCVDGPNQTELAHAEGQQITQVAISPDGGMVAYLAGQYETGFELWVVNADGSNAHKLASKDQLPTVQPDSYSWPKTMQWRPGTHDVYFDTGWTPNGGVQGPGEYTNLDLWRVNADSGELTSVLPADAGGFFTFSPDGNWFTISQGESIDLYHADGSVAANDVLTFDSIITYSEYVFKPRVTWGNDNSFFLAVVPSHDPMAPETAVTIWRANVNGTVVPLINEPGNFVFGGAMVPSPDAQYVAFTTYATDNSGTITLHVKKMDGSNAGGSEVIGVGGVQIFDWSPDSLYFPYSFADQGLFVGTLNLNPQPLATGVQIVKGVQWSDTTTLVFSGSVNDHWGLRQATVGSGFGDLAGPFGDDLVFDVR